MNQREREVVYKFVYRDGTVSTLKLTITKHRSNALFLTPEEGEGEEQEEEGSL